MDNLVKKTLDGRYYIEKLVGVGGMANVYRGTDTSTGAPIAVKVLKEEFLENEELVRRFKNECKAISILNHPHIVKVYDVSVTDKLQYIVMEYVDGITLKEYLKQRGGPLTWKEVVHFATQVLGALQHAHSKGIVHRDVKPQNIMLLADGSIKMMDFGIARFSRAQSQTVSDKAIGSVHYISPEQAKGDRTDARTDLYSVGVMLYEMLSGKLPFDGDGAVSIAIMQISDKAKPLSEVAPNVPEGLRQITEKAMEKEPAKRYQNAKEMLDAIEAFKHNPSIKFEYDAHAMENQNKPAHKPVKSTKPGIRTSEARRAGTSGSAAHGKTTKRRPKKQKEKHFPILPIFFGMAVAFVIGACILVYLIFSNSTNPLFSNREDVTLASFIGMTEDEFRASEYNSQLQLVSIKEYNSEFPAGTIFQQTPRAGRTVKEGQKVTLKISLGIEHIPIPETRSMLAADAEETLKSMGLMVVRHPIVDDTVSSGTVVRTEPAAGETVDGGSTVIMYVSQPKIIVDRQVPSVTGLQVGDARSKIANTNLVPKEVKQPSDQPEGTVLGQSPSAGTTVRMNSPVTIIVSTGVPEVAATPEPESGDGTITPSTWWSSDGSHQINQRSDGTMWNELGQQCDAQGNPLS